MTSRTAAGRAIWDEKPIGWRGQDWRAAVLAIEAEAAALDCPCSEYEPCQEHQYLEAAAREPTLREALHESLAAMVLIAEGPGSDPFARGLKAATLDHAIAVARAALAEPKEQP